MRIATPLLSVLLLGGGASALASVAEKEVHFGLDVAKKGLWQEARFRFEKAVLLDPENASARNDLAVALEQQGEFAQAREMYEKALALKPGSLLIQQNYDLFREADDKRNRKARKLKTP